MKSLEILSDKYENLLLCQNCKFVPSRSELTSYKNYNQSIFQIYWDCTYCQHCNHTTTDSYFKYYSISNDSHHPHIHQDIAKTRDPCEQLIFNSDTNNNGGDGSLVLIDVGPDMADIWASLKGGLAGAINNCVMLSKYLQNLGKKKRLEKGRFFSWNDFLKRNAITKIQFALMLTDQLEQNNKKLDKRFFVFDPNYNLTKQVIEKISVIQESFLQRINHKQPISTLNEILPQLLSCSTAKNVIIISSCPLQNLTKYLQSLEIPLQFPKILLINLQNLTDSITLQPTSSWHFLQSKSLTLSNLVPQINPTSHSPINAHSHSQSISHSHPHHSHPHPNHSHSHSLSNVALKKSTAIEDKDKQKTGWKGSCQKVQVLDFRLQQAAQEQGVQAVENICVFHCLQIVHTLIISKDSEIVIFGRRVKNGIQAKWEKIIEKEKYGEYLQLFLNKQDKIAQQSRLLNQQKSKTYQILHNFSKLCNPPPPDLSPSYPSCPISPHLQTMISEIEHTYRNKYSQLRVCLTYKVFPNVNQPQSDTPTPTSTPTNPNSNPNPHPHPNTEMGNQKFHKIQKCEETVSKLNQDENRGEGGLGGFVRNVVLWGKCFTNCDASFKNQNREQFQYFWKRNVSTATGHKTKDNKVSATLQYQIL